MATHFKGPLLYSSGQRALENLNVSIWPDQFEQFDDFDHGAVDETLRWTIVKDSGASAAVVADATNGEVVLTSTATTDNDGASIQGKQEYFALPSTAGEKLYYECRIKTADADQTDVFAGLCETFATNPENAFASPNAIAFVLTDGSAVIAGRTESGGTETEVTFSPTATATLADATYITLGFIATNGTSTDTVDFFINRAHVGSSQTNIPTNNMKLAFASVSGDATGTKSTTMDYVTAAQDRGVSY